MSDLEWYNRHNNKRRLSLLVFFPSVAAFKNDANRDEGVRYRKLLVLQRMCSWSEFHSKVTAIKS